MRIILRSRIRGRGAGPLHALAGLGLLLLVSTGASGQDGRIQRPAAAPGTGVEKALAPRDLPPPDFVRESHADVQVVAGLGSDVYRYKPETWSPVLVRVFNHTHAPMSGRIRLGSGDGFELDPTRAIHEIEARVEGQSYRTFRLMVNPGRGDGMLVARFEDTVRGSLLAPPGMASGSHMLRDVESHVVILGPERIDPKVGTHRFLIDHRGIYEPVLSYPHLLQLPVEPEGWEGVDLLILTGRRPLEEMSAEQRKALVEAVRQGLDVVMESPGADDTAAAIRLVEEAVPGMDPAVAQRLVAAAGSRQGEGEDEGRARLLEDAEQGPVAAWSLGRQRLLSGPEITVRDDLASLPADQPLLAAAFPAGRGRLTLFTFTLASTPGKSATGLTRWLLRHHQSEMAMKVEAKRRADEGALGALARFEGNRIPSHGKILLFFALYALMLGPGSWLLSRRSRSAMGAWSFHIPVIVVIFSLISFKALRPVQLDIPVVRTFKHVQGELPGSAARAVTYVSHYSPDARPWRVMPAGDGRLVALDRRDHRGLEQQRFEYRGREMRFASFAHATTNLRLSSSETTSLEGRLVHVDNGNRILVPDAGSPAPAKLFVGPIQGLFYELDPRERSMIGLDPRNALRSAEAAARAEIADPTQREIFQSLLENLPGIEQPQLIAVAGPDRDDVTFITGADKTPGPELEYRGVTVITRPVALATGAAPR